MTTLSGHRYKPDFVTLTGVDRFTNLRELVTLTSIYPTEIALLVGNPDNGPRYMHPGNLQMVLTSLLDFREQPGVPQFLIALHLCGSHTGHFAKTGLLPLLNQRPGHGVTRVQINGWQPGEADHETYRYLTRVFGVQPILQHRPRPEQPIPWSPVFDYVQDFSGGRGVQTEHWHSPSPQYLDSSMHSHIPMVGYAGGLSHIDIQGTLPRIAGAAGEVRYWIDMESSLRNREDHFDLWRAERTLLSVKETKDLVRR